MDVIYWVAAGLEAVDKETVYAGIAMIENQEQYQGGNVPA